MWLLSTWRLSSTTIFFMKPPHPNMPFIPLHSKYCMYFTIDLIFYFFLFKNRGVFSLYLPQSLMNFFAIHLFIEWAEILQFLTKKTHSSYKDLQFQGCNLAIFWALNLLYQVLFEPLLTTEINCFEWFWLCIAGSYEKDCFLGDVSAPFWWLFYSLLKRSLQFWDILNTANHRL